MLETTAKWLLHQPSTLVPISGIRFQVKLSTSNMIPSWEETEVSGRQMLSIGGTRAATMCKASAKGRGVEERRLEGVSYSVRGAACGGCSLPAR
jgi:hypothetical protein